LSNIDFSSPTNAFTAAPSIFATAYPMYAGLPARILAQPIQVTSSGVLVSSTDINMGMSASCNVRLPSAFYNAYTNDSNLNAIYNTSMTALGKTTTSVINHRYTNADIIASGGENFYGKNLSNGNFLVENASGFRFPLLLSNSASLGITSNSTIQFEKASLLTGNTCNIAFYSDDISAYNVFSTNVSASVSNAPAGSLFRIESNAMGGNQPAVFVKSSSSDPYTYSLPPIASPAVRTRQWYASNPANYASLLTATEMAVTLANVSGYIRGNVPVSVVSPLPGVTYTAALDGGASMTMTNGTYTFSNLLDGTHSVVVTASNGYYTNSASVSFVEDNTNPTISGLTLVSEPDASGNFQVTFTASDANSMTYASSFDNGSNYNDATASPDNLTLPGYGTYQVKVKVTDVVGNNVVSSAVPVRYAPPVNAIPPLDPTATYAAVKIEGVVNDIPVTTTTSAAISPQPTTGTDIVVRDENNNATIAVAANDNVTADLQGALERAHITGATHILTYVPAMNASASQLATIIPNSGTPTTISGGGVSVDVDTSGVEEAIVSVGTDASGNVCMYFRVFGSNKVLEGSADLPAFSLPVVITKTGVDISIPSIPINHYDSNSFVHIGNAMRILGKTDKFGYTFTYNSVVNATPPTKPARVSPAPSVSDILTTTATLTWTAPDDGGVAITGYDVMNSGFVQQYFAGQGLSGEVTGLIPSRDYTFSVRAKNNIGNGDESDSVTFTTLNTTSIVSGPTYSEPRTLSVVALGGSLTYQWYKNGSPIASGTIGYTGETTSQLHMKGFRNAFIGGYYVVVSGIDGITVTSSQYAITSSTGAADPYISTLDGKIYKLPSFNGHLRLYQGMVGGHLLTINATTRIDDNKSAMDADTELMNNRLAKPLQRDLRMSEAMSFFERIHMNYAGETMVANVYDGFKIEKTASWPVEVVGNVQKYLKAFSFYEHLAGDIIEISPCPEAVLRIGIVPIRSIRNSVELIAPNMAAGNGAFVHRMTQKAMTLRKLSDLKPIEKKDAVVKRTIRETFVCDAKTAVVNIPYVG
jgi:hypothetical protein